MVTEWVDIENGEQIICPACNGRGGDCWPVGVGVLPGGRGLVWTDESMMGLVEATHHRKEAQEIIGFIKQGPGSTGAETDRRGVAVRFLCNSGCVFDIAFGHASAPCSIHGPVIVHIGTGR